MNRHQEVEVLTNQDAKRDTFLYIVNFAGKSVSNLTFIIKPGQTTTWYII